MGKRLSALFILFVFVAAAAWGQSAPYDVVIRNGHIIDGTGSPWYAGDIGIREGHRGHRRPGLSRRQAHH